MIGGYFHHEPNADQVRTILVVGSGRGPEIQKLLNGLRKRFPMAQEFRLIIPLEWSDSLDGTEQLFVYGRKTGLWRNIVHKIRAARFSRVRESDLTVVLLTGCRQYNLMKKLIFIAHTKKVLAYNENMDSFFMDRENRNVLKGHIQWRRRERENTGSISIPVLSTIFRLISKVIQVVVLVAYYVMYSGQIRRLKSYVRQGGRS